MKVLVALFLVLSVSVSSMASGSSVAADSTTRGGSSFKVRQFQPPVFRGVSVTLDLASPLMGLVYGKVVNVEAAVDVNLYRRLYPIVEFGFSSVNKVSSNGAVYSSRAPFFRLGVNYGLMKPFKDDGTERLVKSFPYIGIRYSFAPMNYNIDNVVVSDPYWGSLQIGQFGSPSIYSGWLEVVAGVKIDIYKGFTMGWSVRLKTLFHTTAPDKSFLWYAPGYGTTGGLAFGFSYMMGYTFNYDKTPNKRVEQSSK